MGCLICGQAAKALPSHKGQDGMGWNCSACGQYWVSDSLLQTMHGMRFNVEATRYYLALVRKLGDDFPVLSSHDRSLLDAQYP